MPGKSTINGVIPSTAQSTANNVQSHYKVLKHKYKGTNTEATSQHKHKNAYHRKGHRHQNQLHHNYTSAPPRGDLHHPVLQFIEHCRSSSRVGSNRFFLSSMEQGSVKSDGDDIKYETSRDEAVMAAGGARSLDGGSSPSSSDSESDEEAAEELQIETLAKQLEERPLHYELHVKHSTIFMLSVQFITLLILVEAWLHEQSFTFYGNGGVHSFLQVNFNIGLVCGGAFSSLVDQRNVSAPRLFGYAVVGHSSNPVSENFEEIEKLYERGVHEYLFVPLWCDYLGFVQEHDPLVSECAPAGVSKMRTLFERAVTASGLHFSEGSQVWEAYREFEQAVFLTIDQSDNEEKVKQAQRIQALFHRQLSVPLINIKSTLTDYKLWEAEQGKVNFEFEGVPSNIVSAYKKALEMCNARASYEEQLSNHDVYDIDRLQHFMV
ncbi:hypothetical protein KSP40_PGU005087 [Platanthera guangdongensis]|uniref:Suppressor of forked domain-containing protein n=1 Tax=Platanthera guangdongensis TaxID=2320717 RepID=A0ABR2M9X8_9ASPA